MTWLELRVPPPVVMALVAFSMWFAAGALPALDFALPARGPIVAALAIAGALIGGAALVQFWSVRTTPNPMRPNNATALVESGVYRLSRNPMYLADLVLLAAWALWLGNAAALALLPVFVAYLNRFQIAPEERVLEARFGVAFAHYRRAVRRWL